MKRLFLLTTAILLSALNSNAVNWQPLEVATPNIDVYVDTDSVKVPNSDEYYYAIRYQALGQSEKIAYIKANTKTKNIGIIQAGEYDPDRYRPNAVFATPHALMKPIKTDSFLYYANDLVAQIAGNSKVADSYSSLVYNKSGNEIYVANKYARDVLAPAELKDYLIKTCNILQENWNPPKIGYSTRTIVLATIGADGSLLKYKITEASGNEQVTRSVISALEKTVPYPAFPTKETNLYSLDFQYVFENDTFRKAVVY